MGETDLLRLAEEALDTGNWNEACRIGRQIAAGTAPDVRASYGWAIEGIALRELGRIAESIELLSRAVDDHPDEALFLQELARTHLQAGNHQLACDCAKRADEIAPDSDVTARILGLALVRLGRSAEALAVFEAHGGVSGDEELRNLTAAAIIGMAEARFEPVGPELAGPTSPEAAEAVISLMDRVRSIDGLHEEERSAAEQLRQAATDALGKRYLGGFASVIPHLGLSFLVFIVVLIASSQSVLAVLAAIALLAVLTIRRIQPGWKGFREAAEAYRRSGAEGQ